jgi:alkylation response protein AidB-like acyl-CoA dehydrogenase
MTFTTVAPDWLSARFAPVFEQICEGTRAHERERSLPYEEVRLLADAGFGALRLPVSEGGGGATLVQFFELLVRLAAVDSNQPQIWRNHIAFVEDRLQPTVESQNRHWRELLADGAVVGGAWSELGTKFRESNTRLTQNVDGWVLNGVKYYSTGSIFADFISVAAKRDEEDLIVIVNARAPGVEIVDDWSGFGQRTTGSGTAKFTDVVVDEISTYPFKERSPYQEAVYQLVLLATLAGIGRAAHYDLVSALRKRERAYGHGLSEVPRHDAQLQAVVGRVAALASAAEASVARAAGYLDGAAALAIEGDADEIQLKESVNQAAIAVYEAQLTVTSDVLTGTTLLFDGLGSSAVDVSAQLDRHWRNARTVTSHNPRVYKERIVGDWYLNGTAPSVFGRESDKEKSEEPAKDA